MNTQPDIPDFETKLQAFIQRLQSEKQARAAREFPSLTESAKAHGWEHGPLYIDSNPGPRFVRIVEQKYQSSRSVCYFVERATGIIFGASGWAKYNPARTYGTLDTIAEWDWSEYYAVSKHGKSTLVPIEERR